MTSRAGVHASFQAMLKSIACPSCDISFTDAAVRWCDAWCEGRHDLLVELKSTERDGPVKIWCEYCGTKALINYFSGTATVVS